MVAPKGNLPTGRRARAHRRRQALRAMEGAQHGNKINGQSTCAGHPWAGRSEQGEDSVTHYGFTCTTGLAGSEQSRTKTPPCGHPRPNTKAVSVGPASPSRGWAGSHLGRPAAAAMVLQSQRELNLEPLRPQLLQLGASDSGS